MVTRSNTPLTFRGQRFYGAAEIGFDEKGTFVASLYTYAPPFKQCGNFFSTLPISSALHRQRDPSACGFVRAGDSLTIFDDWGDASTISAAKDVVDALVAELLSNEVPARESKD